MSTISLPTKRPFSWKVFWFILALLIPATFASLPYALTLQSATLQANEWPSVVIGTLVNGLIYGVLAGIGLFLAGRIGLGLPFVEGWLRKERTGYRFQKVLVISVVIGVAVGLILLGIGRLVFMPLLTAQLDSLGISIPEDVTPPAWQGFLASFSAGITEEVIFRLFGLTLLAWLGSLVSRDSEGRPSPVVFWIANILIAVAFGLAHLPITATVGLPLTPLVIVRAITLNGIGGLISGWLYRQYGLESAVLAHFSCDVVLHVLVPLVAPLAL